MGKCWFLVAGFYCIIETLFLPHFQDESFMKKLRAQFAFLEVKAPTLVVYLNYFQERMPHVTQAHEKMESLLQYLHANTNVEEDLNWECLCY